MTRLTLASRRGAEHLGPLVEKIKRRGRGKKYDAVLGISGGVDSTYLALLLRQWGVRTLLVHMDNGWDTCESVENILAVARETGFDYESAVLDWEEFRDLQLAFLKASVVEAESPTDMAIPGVLFRTARAHNVSFIASASNEVSEGILPRLWHYDGTDLRYLKAVHRQFGTLPLRRYPSLSLAGQFGYRLLHRIRTVYPLNHIDYDPPTVREMLKRDIGWQDYGGKHHESVYTKFVQTVLLPRKFGFDYRRATLSNLVCAGKVSRQEALRKLEASAPTEFNREGEFQYVARKLRITPEELERIVAAPPKSYSDYPNSERGRRIVYGLYRWLFNALRAVYGRREL